MADDMGGFSCDNAFLSELRGGFADFAVKRFSRPIPGALTIVGFRVAVDCCRACIV
jgi:hypothetical protein